VERKYVKDWVSKCRKLKVVGNRGRVIEVGADLRRHGNSAGIVIEGSTESCMCMEP